MASTIEKTILSVISQTCKDIEYIIVDGKSTDNTMSIIGKYKNNIDLIISEKDTGIYNAMNKGIKNASGDIIYFLNAGDYLYDSNVINEVLPFFNDNPKIELINGDIKKVYSNPNYSIIISRKLSLKKLHNGIQPPHQATFIKRDKLYNLRFFLKIVIKKSLQ